MRDSDIGLVRVRSITDMSSDILTMNIARPQSTSNLIKSPSLLSLPSFVSSKANIFSRRSRRPIELVLPLLRDRKGCLLLSAFFLLGIFTVFTLILMSGWIFKESAALSMPSKFIKTSTRKHKSKQILVMGMSRSGTSLTTSLIAAMGANWVGSSLAFTRNMAQLNPKGFFERADVIRLNYHDLGSYLGIDWKDPSTVGTMTEANESKFNYVARRIVEDMDKHVPWVLKDPRFCILLPYWIPLLKDPICVIVFRHPLEVKASAKMKDPVRLWEIYTVSAIKKSSKLCPNRIIFVSHASLLRNTIYASRELSRKLVQELQVEGLKELTDEEILNVVDNKLYHNKVSPNTTVGLTPSQICLWKALQDGSALYHLSC